MLKAYGDIKARQESKDYDLPTFTLMSSDEAFSRLSKMLGNLPKNGLHTVWATLHSFLPEDSEDTLYTRSASGVDIYGGSGDGKAG